MNDIYNNYGRYNYIAVKFYENICNIIKGQKVALVTQCGGEPDKNAVLCDAITGTPLMNVRLSGMNFERYTNSDKNLTKYKYFDSTCTDVVIKDKKMFAVLQYGESTFTVELNIRNPKEIGPYSSVIDVNHSGRDVILLPKPTYDKAIRVYEETEREKQARIEAEKKAEEQRKNAEEQKRLQRRQYLMSKYGAENGKLISEHKVVLDMTMEMCQESWGIPNNKRTQITHDGRYDIWIYMDSELYFSNDRLVKIVTK